MKIGLVGLPQSGKKTFFRLLTGIENTGLDFGICKISDSRLDLLCQYYQPKKIVKGEIELTLLPSINPGEGSFKPVLDKIRKQDALCLIIRDFADESVFHINNTVDGVRDLKNLITEIILNDLSLAETRLLRIAQEQKRNFSEDRVKEEKALIKIKTALENEKMLSSVSLSSEDQKAISSLSFISGINLLVAVNISEADINSDEKKQKIASQFPDIKDNMLFISAKIEKELYELPEEDKASFMKDLGIKEPAIPYMTRKAGEVLDLITFFTVGKDETKAWMIRKNSTALEAAAKIHSDIAKGFIRAEIFKYSDFVALGSEEKIKEKGLFSLKGKEYVMADGDVACFRFNI